MWHSYKDIQLYYETQGGGLPLLILHGYYVDNRLMQGCMEPLFSDDARFLRIYPDLPGMGKTKAGQSVGNADEMLDLLADFVDAVLPGQDFALVGESYGGYLAQGLLARMKNRVKGAFLLCPVVEPHVADRTLPPFELREDALLGVPGGADEGFVEMAVRRTPETWARYQAEIQPGVRCADGAFLERYREQGYGFKGKPLEREFCFAGPVLLLTGRQDADVGYADSYGLLGHFFHASFAVLDRAGHNLQIEQPELFSALVRDWLGQLGNQ